MRIPPELRERVKRLAEADNRSETNMVIVMLQEGCERREKGTKVKARRVGAFD